MNLILRVVLHMMACSIFLMLKTMPSDCVTNGLFLVQVWSAALLFLPFPPICWSLPILHKHVTLIWVLLVSFFFFLYVTHHLSICKSSKLIECVILEVSLLCNIVLLPTSSCLFCLLWTSKHFLFSAASFVCGIFPLPPLAIWNILLSNPTHLLIKNPIQSSNPESDHLCTTLCLAGFSPPYI